MTKFLSLSRARKNLSKHGWVELRTSPRLTITGEPESVTFWNRHTGHSGCLRYQAVGDWQFAAPAGWLDAVKLRIQNRRVSEPHTVVSP